MASYIPEPTHLADESTPNSACMLRAVIAPNNCTKSIKSMLSVRGIINKSYKIASYDPEHKAIPLIQALEDYTNTLNFDGVNVRIIELAFSPATHRSTTPYLDLVNALSALLPGCKLSNQLIHDIPNKWDRFGDLILLPANSFISKDWETLPDLWLHVAKALKCKRILRNYPISNDKYRQPRAIALFGCPENTVVRHVENNITYQFDITRCMFCSGNISEKLRLSKFDCTNEVIVDLFAGIGYFILTYLLHCNAKRVFACEWNPYAIQSLNMNLKLNGVNNRCVVIPGDNRLFAPQNVADRVNLGLLPSSEMSWEAACKCLKKPEGGIVHVHGNVNSLRVDAKYLTYAERKQERYPASEVYKMWSQYVSCRFMALLNNMTADNWSVTVLNICRVKSYAPHISHIVADIRCTLVAYTL